MEIPKVIKAEIDEIKTPSNRLLIIILIVGFMSVSWLYVSISNGNTKDLKLHILEIESRIIKKDEIITALQIELINERREARTRVESENVRLTERLLLQEKAKGTLKR